MNREAKDPGRIRTLDLFCGGGGSSWGASRVGAEIVAGVDGWKLAADTFADNFPTASSINSWLRPNSSRRVLRGVVDVDLLLASPECTNHTCARGSRHRDEASRRTARYVLNFARALNPRWVVIENVVQMKSWSGFNSLIAELRRSYYVRTVVLDSARFGVPQKRRRLFVLCDSQREPPIIATTPSCMERSALEVLDPPGTWAARPLFNRKRAVATRDRARRAIKVLGAGIPFLIVYYGSDGAGGWQSLDKPLRTLTTLDRFGLVEWNGSEPMLRMLQVPELKRAMGFDDTFVMNHGTRREQIKLLGNAVCPPVVGAIVRELCMSEGGTNSEDAKKSAFRMQPPIEVAA